MTPCEEIAQKIEAELDQAKRDALILQHDAQCTPSWAVKTSSGPHGPPPSDD